MNFLNDDINDDEIRIISSKEINRTKPAKWKKLSVWLCCIAALLIICGIGLMFFSASEEIEDDTCLQPEDVRSTENTSLSSEQVSGAKPYVEKNDTVVDGVRLTVLTPFNATPTLVIGNDALNDGKIVLAVQASDIRGDNGEIAGLFVVKGNLVSRGGARAGFCSIIDGEMSVGVADATSMLEQALTSGGYFFRQFPLVVGGQVVENKPKGKALRKALAEIDGRICVIMSDDRVSYHDFSQALVDAGVRNAIALVGGNSVGRYTDAKGNTVSFGKKWDQDFSNINYIVWR